MSRRLKILAVSDQVVDVLYNPGSVERFGDVDLVISCGDLPYSYLEYIVTVLDKPTYFVHGNHDLIMEYTEAGLQRTEPGGAQSLDGRALVGPKQLLLAGLEGSIRYDPHSPYQYSQSEMNVKAWRLSLQLLRNRLRYGRYLDVLVTHSPPFGVGDGPDYAHVGFKVFNILLRWFKPRYMLHGHQHIYTGPKPGTHVGSTRVLNVFPYRLIEWEDAHG
jgi:Icc-related predicted phosphoesterase